MDAFLLNELTRNIAIALQEDQIDRDLTSKSCFSGSSSEEKAQLILKQEALLAGLICIPLVCSAVDVKIRWELHKKEGEKAQKDDLIATLIGPVSSLMALERALLNFIQHATSIATKVATYVKIVDGKCEILDTRKTLPGHRFLQKYAVSIGGGTNHRLHLGDQILIKDNHLAHLQKICREPIPESIRRAQAKYPEKSTQIEISNLNDFTKALQTTPKPSRILLDNMLPKEVQEAVTLCPQGIYLEASGGINLTNIRSYAETGIHGISIGSLTHSIDAVDMSIKI